ncbi:MAG TPA: hypothetical protein VK665_13340, partial [Candidatus Elarobacter sp.]|nr:hypothetical protein [Candidatus Elarobacter sp.]
IPSPSPVFETASPDPVARAGGNGKRFHRPMPADFFVLSEDTPGLYAGFVDCKPAGEDADVAVEVVNDYRQVAHFDLSLRPSSHWTWPWDRDWLRERPHIQPGARWRAVHRVKGLDCSRDIRFDVGDLDFNDP